MSRIKFDYKRSQIDKAITLRSKKKDNGRIIQKLDIKSYAGYQKERLIIH